MNREQVYIFYLSPVLDTHGKNNQGKCKVVVRVLTSFIGKKEGEEYLIFYLM